MKRERERESQMPATRRNWDGLGKPGLRVDWKLHKGMQITNPALKDAQRAFLQLTVLLLGQSVEEKENNKKNNKNRTYK